MGGEDSNTSNVSRLGESLDPTSYLIDAAGGEDAWSPHDVGNYVADKSNEYAAPVTTWLNKGKMMTNPWLQWLDENDSIYRSWNQTVDNRPADAAAIVAGAYGAGAAGGLYGGSAGSSLGGTGNAAASSAITPAFSSGAGGVGGASTAGSGLGAAGQAYGSSMLGLGGTSAGANAAAVGAGGGIGGLGASGTAAATTAISPTFGGSTVSYMGQLYDKAKTGYNYYNKGKQVYDALKPQDEPDLNQPMIKLQNPYQTPTDPNRYLRGY